MADIKNSEAPLSTTTIDKNKVDAPTNNIYEAISIISKRANQINGDIKKELLEKLLKSNMIAIVRRKNMRRWCIKHQEEVKKQN